jgi:S-adenosyl-L-methionine hydrolase (adenosine-forming)
MIAREDRRNFMPVISMMTDFGLKDGFTGVMKGVIWGIAPDAAIADLSHMIAPQNIREAALILARSVPYFPENSIHVVVVDPGVGTTRRPMAAKIGGQYYVGPDNGTITLLLERAEREGWDCEFIHLDKSQFWLDKISYVFHGRDIFAPVAAHLANGISLKKLGTPLLGPVRIALPKPEQTERGWRGEIIHIDHFGNLACNIRIEHIAEALKQKETVTVSLAGTTIQGMVNTFGERQPGDLVALIGSTGNLVVSVVNGSAAARLGIQVGESIEFEAG